MHCRVVILFCFLQDGAGNDQVNLVATTADGTLVLYYNRDKSELMIGATSIRDPNGMPVDIFSACIKQSVTEHAYTINILGCIHD